MPQWPALVVTSGPQAGQVFTIMTEHAVLGRSAAADIVLHSDNVSRRHLEVSRRGPDLVVQDLDSANGTRLNGRALHGKTLLRPGDELGLAELVLQYVVLGGGPGAGPAPAAHSYDFGNVHGPVNTGDPVNQSGSQVVGQGSIYHGSVHHGDRIEIADLNPLQELFSGRGPGRALIAVGLLVAIVGFGIWMSVIFSGMTTMGSGPPEPLGNPFEAQIFGVSAPITGFAMFGGGGLLATLGAGMSKAARQREARRLR